MRLIQIDIARARRIASLALAIPLLALAGCSGGAPDADEAIRRLETASAATPEWLTHGGTYDEQRFSALDQINEGNTAQLGLAWYANLDTARGQEATPLVVDGVIYVTTAWSKAVAFDAATGKQLWSYDPKVPGIAAFNACCDVVNRGGAYFDGTFYFATLDGRLIALDASTGAERWSVMTVDQSKPYTITGAPRVIKGNVLIGNAGAEYGVRGYVTAYDAKTGKQAWRFYTVPRPDGRSDGAVSDAILKVKAATTWSDGAWKQTGGGGTVWDAIVYDRKYNRIYIGVGNGAPWNHDVRSGGKGDNLFLSSIVALDAQTGEYAWHYQTTPAESWDFTATQPIVLATLKIDGKSRDVLMQAPKNGFFYVLDRATGKLVSAKNFVRMNWATHVDMKTGRPVETDLPRRYDGTPIWPGPLGAHSWHPMAFSPKTGLVYIPVQDAAFPYSGPKEFHLRPGQRNSGAGAQPNNAPVDAVAMAGMRTALKGSLMAWDPVAGREAWRHENGPVGDGGVLATAGGLVFQGTAGGAFNALSAQTGKPLWRFDAQDSVMGGPVTYSIGGTQYVAVLAGQGGSINLAIPVNRMDRPSNGRLLVFKLKGSEKLPPLAKTVMAPPNPAAEGFAPAQVAKGALLFATNCSQCHGTGAMSAGVVPDLRRSAAVADKRIWDGIVLDGALEPSGMISFRRFLKPDEVEAIRAYVSSRAETLKRAGP
ncbi:MAG TPA: PQQ-dependent dehydrogenase, methanol/ethanol family [Novosphingobium sp.]|nr:PQQ-dependent dehydrogenase, methanol/ethanol family [Novosphingobium sp.]